MEAVCWRFFSLATELWRTQWSILVECLSPWKALVWLCSCTFCFLWMFGSWDLLAWMFKMNFRDAYACHHGNWRLISKSRAAAGMIVCFIQFGHGSSAMWIISIVTQQLWWLLLAQTSLPLLWEGKNISLLWNDLKLQQLKEVYFVCANY